MSCIIILHVGPVVRRSESAFNNWLLIGVTRDKYNSTNLWFHRFSGNFRKVEKVTSDPLDSAIQSDIRTSAPGVDNQHEKNN